MGSDKAVDGGVGDDGGGVDVDDGLGSNALGRIDELDNVESDNNGLVKPGNMDVCHHVVPHNHHACNRIAYFFLLSISI